MAAAGGISAQSVAAEVDKMAASKVTKKTPVIETVTSGVKPSTAKVCKLCLNICKLVHHKMHLDD